jgi:LysM repeat protein
MKDAPDLVRVTTYVVKPGDTASEIAQTVASHRHPLEKQLGLMQELNGGNLDKLRVGQRICIPTKEQPGFVLYHVCTGDTLSQLAERFNTTIGLLQVINKMGDSETLRAGEYLHVPYDAPRSLVEEEVSAAAPANTPAVNPTLSSTIESFVARLKSDFGELCRKFESKGKTNAYSNAEVDPGGASWGCYQIAQSTMPMFLHYLKSAQAQSELTPEQQRVAAKAYEALQHNKPDSTAFQRDWNYIAHTDPRDFRALQHNFILDTHLTPVLKEAHKLGFDITPQTAEVFLSIGVQHGRFETILREAARSIDLASAPTEQQIAALYDKRREYVEDIKEQNLEDVSKLKGLSKAQKKTEAEKVERLWNSVLSRYDREEKLALNLDQGDKG